MSSDVDPAHEKDVMYDTYCPNCAHDGLMDGQGPETKDYPVTDSEGCWHVTEERSSLRCPKCGTFFLVVDEKTRELIEEGADQ